MSMTPPLLSVGVPLGWRTVSLFLFSACAMQSQGFSFDRFSIRCFPFDFSPSWQRKEDLLMSNNHKRKSRERLILQLSASSPTSQPTRLGWEARIQQLRDYKHVHGHTHVRRNTVDPPGLANWVNKQRQMYVRYQNGKRPCSLNEQRIAALEELGFCWDGRKALMDESNSIQEQTWWDSLNEFQTIQSTKDVEILASSKLGRWLRQQRLSFTSGRLTKEQQDSLHRIDPDWWMSRQQRAWEQHFRALQAYAKETGDCSVPVNHPNRQLANFVANQRKQYSLRQKERPSAITDERIKRLESIGFVWSKWDHDFLQRDDMPGWSNPG